MIDIGSKVAELIAAGCAPEVAARVVAETYVSGVESASVRGHSADTQADERRRRDRERKRLRREFPQNSAESADIPQNSKSASTLNNINTNTSLERDAQKAEHPRTNRGHRLPQDWRPTPQDRETFAALLGADVFAHELEKFLDHWPAQPGQKGVKVDWNMTFRNWMRNVRPPRGQKPLTAHQQERQTTRDILNDLGNFASGGGSRGDEDPRLLPRDPGERPEGVRSGFGSDVIDLSASGYRSSR